MGIADLFSKRQRRLRGDVPDVYIYDSVPEPLRVQIVHIWTDSIGSETEYYSDSKRVQSGYRMVVEILCREYGRFRLSEPRGARRNYMDELIQFFLEESVNDKVLDVIELSFRVVDRFTRDREYRRRNDGSKLADSAISELNGRFKEHGIGYQYEGGELIRIDSQLLHSEVVKPALRLLAGKGFSGPQQEFFDAYENYRRGRNKEALNDCLKSFESTMKAICTKRQWEFESNDTSKRLLEVCFDKGLIPSFWQQKMGGLRALLEGGVPTARNKLSGHGQGELPTSVPDYIVSYVLHMTGAAIVFLVEAEKNLH